MIDETNKKARLSSILGIVLFPTVPLSYLSAVIYNSLHPLINPNPGQGNIYWEPIKMFSLFFNLFAMTIFFTYALIELVEVDKLKQSLAMTIQNKLEEH